MRAQDSSLVGLLSALCVVTACSAGGSGTSASSTSTSGTSSTSTSGTGGAGGAGGATTTTTSGTGGATTTTTTTTGTGGAGTGGAGGNAGTLVDHVWIAEIGVAPAGGEFIEIENPTAAAVDLSDYYLSDNSGYHGIAVGQPWNPVTSNKGTDFLAQFPAGTMLQPGARILIATDPTFEALYMKCPDFILDKKPLACANGMAQAMVAPVNGGIGDADGTLVAGTLLSNAREMVILFKWSGGNVVQDVDYVTWGPMFDDASRVDKTGVQGYKADTARGSQKAAAAPTAMESIERCSAGQEPGEKASGGNGITAHDETSEALDQSFKLQTKPTPGAKNSCL